LLNDTVATLLAGKSASFGREYDSFIGFILGTGTNTCYIESNKNILKTGNLDQAKSQIINIETGAMGKVPRSDLDTIFDKTTVNPGSYKFEKMFAGGYFGGLCLTTLKAASEEGLLSPGATKGIMILDELSSGEVNSFVTGKVADCSPLSLLKMEKADTEICIGIIEGLIDRSAKLVAANIAAVILKTNKGKTADKPILITIEGTTFYRMHNLRIHFERYLNQYLKDDNLRFYEFTEVQQSSLVGAALAALIN
jgi:hexokinase